LTLWRRIKLTYRQLELRTVLLRVPALPPLQHRLPLVAGS